MFPLEMRSSWLAPAALVAVVAATACKEGPTGPCDPECGPDEECLYGVCRPICDPPCPEGWYCYHPTGMCFYGSLPDASTDPGWEPEPSCASPDTDGDLITDEVERAWDVDGDTVPNDEDLDSDGDTILDMHEAGDLDCDSEPVDYDGDTLYDFLDTDSDQDGILDGVEAGDEDLDTRPVDSDGWGHGDFRDTDSDNDGLGDEQETELGTDPTLADTDGDGYDDMQEMASQAGDPLLAASHPGDSERIFVLWYRGRSQYEMFTFKLQYKATDVFFVVDDTNGAHAAVQAAAAALDDGVAASMQSSLEGLRTGLALYSGWVVPGAIVDPVCRRSVAGLARLDGVDPGRVAGLVGEAPRCPEPLLGSSLVSALFEAAGEGSPLVWDEDAGECVGGTGGACFAPGARHVIVALHAGSFASSTPAGYGAYHTMDEVTALLAGSGIHAVGLVAGDAGDPAIAPLTSLAASTGARDHTGRELVYIMGADGASARDALVHAVSDIATSLPTDATLTAVDGSDWPGGDEEVDAGRLVSIWPEGFSPPPGFSLLEACDEMEGDSYLGCVPGTRVSYQVYYRNYTVEQQVHGQVLRVTLVLSGSDGYEFASVPASLIVPALDGDSF